MPKILIIAKHDDPHSEAVVFGLKKIGQKPIIWYWEDFPRFDSATLWINAKEKQQDNVLLNLKSDQNIDKFDVIWLRRRGDPIAIKGSHPDDVEIIHKESKLFIRNILPILGHSETRWINHPDAEDRAILKTTQLYTARMLGFQIPETLIGNNVKLIRQFVMDHPGGVVHKSFHSHSWEDDNGSCTVSRTSKITLAQLENNFSVRACPSIYQAEIEKKYELRVTVIGGTVLASLIDSQRGGSTVDWRHDGERGRTNLSTTEIEPELAERCRTLCRQLGLAFGCIDLIVTPRDEVVFLEINCAGQFLFNELADPNIPMLDTFCKFLAYGDIPAYKPQLPLLRFGDFIAAKNSLKNHFETQHR
jgi:glutathione synthase/RimK-type ligase-like ATP-grasp enzyme